MSSSRSPIDRRLSRLQLEGRPGHDLGRIRWSVLEHALAIGEPEPSAIECLLGAVAAHHARCNDDLADIRFMRAGVRPHGATDSSRDGEAELQTGQALLFAQRRGLGHRQARVRGQPIALEPGLLCAVVDDQAADAGIADRPGRSHGQG